MNNENLYYDAELEDQESIVKGILGGFLGMIIGTILWGTVIAITGLQIALVAIAVGFIVGKGVKILGKGNTLNYGIIGAIFAFLGCVLGSYISLVYEAANMYGLSFMDVFKEIPIIDGIKFMFTGSGYLDYLFYGLAIYEGFKFSIID